MAEAIHILVGTMTGTAEMVADELKAVIEEVSGHPVEILPMDDLDAEVFRRDGLFLVCTSTYGQGDVPDNAQAFYQDLGTRRPDLGHVRYGVFGLGDTTYEDTYNNGGKRFDERLAELGARRIGERQKHDASGDHLPEDQAAEWVRDWLKLLAPATAE